jgi:hypothetical protein
MGIAGKHVLKTYGEYSDIKVRFAGVVYPGETVATEMWKEGNKVFFRMSPSSSVKGAVLTGFCRGQGEGAPNGRYRQRRCDAGAWRAQGEALSSQQGVHMNMMILH